MLGNNRVQSRFFPALVATREGVASSHAVSVCGLSCLIHSITVEAIDCTKPYNFCIVGSFTMYLILPNRISFASKAACIQALDSVTGLQTCL